MLRKRLRDWGKWVSSPYLNMRRAGSFGEFHRWNSPEGLDVFPPFIFVLLLTYLPWGVADETLKFSNPSFSQLSLRLKDLRTKQAERMRLFCMKPHVRAYFTCFISLTPVRTRCLGLSLHLCCPTASWDHRWPQADVCAAEAVQRSLWASDILSLSLWSPLFFI